jgi:hypothetical protein
LILSQKRLGFPKSVSIMAVPLRCRFFRWEDCAVRDSKQHRGRQALSILRSINLFNRTKLRLSGSSLYLTSQFLQVQSTDRRIGFGCLNYSIGKRRLVNLFPFGRRQKRKKVKKRNPDDI